MDLYTNFIPVALAFIAVALVATLAGLTTIVVTIVSNRRVRLARHESIPAFYRGLVLSH